MNYKTYGTKDKDGKAVSITIDKDTDLKEVNKFVKQYPELEVLIFGKKREVKKKANVKKG